ncbi:MAG: nuclear transport factor 2 family protein [Candidatus Acidiferrum sp.]
MDIRFTAFQRWLDAYGQAWVSRDPKASAALFADTGTYQVTPFDTPIRGREAILQNWNGVARTEENIKFAYQMLFASADLNIAQWSASFDIIPQGLQTKLDGIFLISLDDEGRCKSLREWWHKQQK